MSWCDQGRSGGGLTDHRRLSIPCAMSHQLPLDAFSLLQEGHVTTWESPELTSLNKLPPRATFVTFANREQALTGEQAQSPWILPLNGVWDFRLAACLLNAFVEQPVDFGDDFRRCPFGATRTLRAGVVAVAACQVFRCGNREEPAQVRRGFAY